MTSVDSHNIKILTPREISRILGKSVRWVYDHAAELGGVKIGSSWIFTEGGLRDALQRGQEMARGRQIPRAEVHGIIRQKGRSNRLGASDKKGVKSRKKNAQEHGLDEFLSWVFGPCPTLFDKDI